jgi:hypothetical protein
MNWPRATASVACFVVIQERRDLYRTVSNLSDSSFVAFTTYARQSVTGIDGTNARFLTYPSNVI